MLIGEADWIENEVKHQWVAFTNCCSALCCKARKPWCWWRRVFQTGATLSASPVSAYNTLSTAPVHITGTTYSQATLPLQQHHCIRHLNTGQSRHSSSKWVTRHYRATLQNKWGRRGIATILFQLVDMIHLLESYVYYRYTENALVHHRDFWADTCKKRRNTRVFLGNKIRQKKTKI